jgi:hypothetical protein
MAVTVNSTAAIPSPDTACACLCSRFCSCQLNVMRVDNLTARLLA